MKTTLEIPDSIFRRAKAEAAEQGVALRELISQAIAEKLERNTLNERRPWMKAFGSLRGLRDETRKVNRIIQEEFEQIDPADWR
jgi:hypothetical protein